MKQISYSDGIMPGSYYDVQLEDSSISLYAQSKYFSDKDQDLPTLGALRKMYSGLDRSAKSYGITSPYKTPERNIVTVSHRAAKAMSNYIRKITLGENLDPSGSEARDHHSFAKNERFLKIFKRADCP